MIGSYSNILLAVLFAAAYFGALVHPFLPFSIVVVLLLVKLFSASSKQYRPHRQTAYEAKNRVILFGFIVACLFMPQIALETNPLANGYEAGKIQQVC